MTDQGISPLHRRMLEDMAIRNLAPKDPSRPRAKGQGLRDVPQPFSDTVKSEEVRGFRLYLASSGAGTIAAPVASAIHAF
jgi:hypothetical protein